MHAENLDQETERLQVMTFEGCVLSAVFAGKNTNMITQSYLSDPHQIFKISLFNGVDLVLIFSSLRETRSFSFLLYEMEFRRCVCLCVQCS